MAELNRFVRTLREITFQESVPSLAGTIISALIILIIIPTVAVVLSIYPDRSLPTVATAGFVLYLLGFIHGRAKRKEIKTLPFQTDLAELLNELVWMEKSKSLSERTHPALKPILERVSLARAEALTALNSQEWRQKSKAEPWKQTRLDCIRTADEAWLDVVWISRNLFRRRQWRKDTFAKNCLDPHFGQHALQSAEEATSVLEALAANIKGEDETDQSIINKTRKQLELLRQAEKELGPEPDFLQYEDKSTLS